MLAVMIHVLVIADAPIQADGPVFGNVFLDGETVSVSVPENTIGWRVLDDSLNPVAYGAVEDWRVLHPGPLPIGWYRIEFLDASNECIGFTPAAVVHKPAETASGDSPVAVDIALSWLAREEPEKWPEITRLATLTGVQWVRDRIHWREMQAETGEFLEETHYDTTARIQSDAGLEILQVFHTVPSWARDTDGEGDRPRTNLLHLHRFCEGMAQRFKGRVDAWEPWNEGNAGNFGGLTIDELCSLQKAAYLGFKRGDPDLPVCWAPLGGVNTAAQAETVLRNETWPYYDIYSIHSYDWPHAYAQLWEPARRAACGRPIWVTECDRGMKADPASPVGDYTHEYARLKAYLMAQSYACSLFSGSSRHFHFILGPYMEGERTVQFGLLREDYTPRLSYVAFAALGRFLNGARCLGRWDEPEQPDAHVYVFRAMPDGEAHDLLVAWVEKEANWPARGTQSLPWPLPEELKIEAAFDYLGRPLDTVPPGEITSAPVYAVLPEGAADALPLKTIPRSEYREGTPSPVVLQFDTPDIVPVIRQRAWTQEPERVFKPGTDVDCALLVYNFAQTDINGTISVTELPEGLAITPNRWNVTLAPQERTVLSLQMTIPASHEASDEDWVVFQGDFGPAGKPVLAFQVNRPEN
ncbi:MAG: hypothetical protein U9Q79_01305 [Candidatus Hydrogenedentes bacterium]|nr:hypothetical protein [Candidatus Hydrogenedentota bacterium]